MSRLGNFDTIENPEKQSSKEITSIPPIEEVDRKKLDPVSQKYKESSLSEADSNSDSPKKNDSEKERLNPREARQGDLLQEGTARENPAYGIGGGKQYFIPDGHQPLRSDGNLPLTNAHLPVKGKAKKKEKQKPVQKRASAGVSIEKRPEEIMTREEFGHWEMDTVKGKRGVTKSCLLVLSERKTRNEIVIKMPDQGAASVVASLDMLEEKWGKLFSTVFKSITVDNGVEFSDTVGLERSCLSAEKRTALYYCHAYSSWERGTNENINKLIRRHIPKGVDFDDRTADDIVYIENWINNYPRRLFKFKTSRELFEAELANLA